MSLLWVPNVKWPLFLSLFISDIYQFNNLISELVICSWDCQDIPRNCKSLFCSFFEMPWVREKLTEHPLHFDFLVQFHKLTRKMESYSAVSLWAFEKVLLTYRSLQNKSSYVICNFFYKFDHKTILKAWNFYQKISFISKK